MRTLLCAAALLALSPCSLAQQGAKNGTRESDEALRERINDRIQHMRKSIDEGLPITTNVQVTVWLRNKYRLRGVVKGGRFVEKVHGLDFVSAEMQTPGAGIRVWYYDNTNSYIFLPFEGIARYKIGARLTEVQIKKIEERIEARTKSAEEKRQAAQARLKARQALEEGKKKGEEEAAEEVVSEEEKAAKEKEQRRLLALLDEFPPERGWGPEKIKEIERRKIAIGAFPDEKSKRFMGIFEEWMKALKLKEQLEAEKQSGAQKTTGEKSEGEKGEESGSEGEAEEGAEKGGPGSSYGGK